MLALPDAYTSGAIGTLHICGAVRLRKSEWALAQFANPLHVTERIDLLNFRPGWHDGIVIDKSMPCERPSDGFTLQECEKLSGVWPVDREGQICRMMGCATVDLRVSLKV